MSEFLKALNKRKNYQKCKKRVGRGAGSGKGSHTTGKGTKGQKARNGGKTKLYFEGGQMPLIRRLPYKKGFNNINSKDVFSVNFYDIEKFASDVKSLTPDFFRDKFKLGKNTTVKILSKGVITKKVELKGFVYSKKAVEKAKKMSITLE